MAGGESLVQIAATPIFIQILYHYGKKGDYWKTEKVFHASRACMSARIQEVFGIADMELFHDGSTGNPADIEGRNPMQALHYQQLEERRQLFPAWFTMQCVCSMQGKNDA